MASAHNRPDVLLAKYLTKTLTEDEKEFFDAWVNSAPRHKQLVEALEQQQVLGQQLKDVASITDAIVEEDRKQLSARLLGAAPATPAEVRPIRTYRLWWKVAAAAGIIALVFAGYQQFFQRSATPETAVVKEQTVPTPGTDKAVLVLADGKRIILDSVSNTTINLGENVAVVDPDKGLLTYQASRNNIHTVGQNTLQTPNGGQYKVQLSDGSTAWLNAASSITYPTHFTGNKREISITGEIYLEVAKNKQMPFIVHVGKEQTIEVLGTKFAVNAYNDEPVIKTTLVEGSVQVTTSLANNQVVKLKPGQQSQVSPSTLHVIKDANVEEATAFINGYFYFDNADITTVMRQLGKWYDIKVIYSGSISNRKFQGKIQRSLSLPVALKILGRYGVDFEVKGNEVYVKPKI